ncbi:MAG: ABC transporter substrate-binding protein [Candidatus Dormibacteria bacterium]
MPRSIWTKLALAGAVSLLMAACGSTGTAKPQPKPTSLTDVTFTLNFTAGGPQAGFMYAQQLGYYRQVGLNVKIIEGTGSVTTAEEVAAGTTELGFSDGPSSMSVIAKGGALEIVAPILQTNGFSIMTLKSSNITSVSQLAGKTIALQPGTAQTALLNAILAKNGMSQSSINVENVAPSAIIGLLLEHKVTAILGGADFQAIQLEQQGAQLNQLLYYKIGVPTIGLSIIANEHLVQTQTSVISRFVSASLKGWAAARKNPQAAANAVAAQFPAAGTAAQYLPELKVDLNLLCSAPGATHLGSVPAAIWQDTYNLLTKYDNLPTTLPVGDYYTAAFEPKSPPTCG